MASKMFDQNLPFNLNQVRLEHSISKFRTFNTNHLSLYTYYLRLKHKDLEYGLDDNSDNRIVIT